VLNGTVAAEPATVEEGTVVRIRLHGTDHGAPQVTAMNVIAEGFPERTDIEALVVGPTGVALGSNGTLYVADTDHSRIAAIPDALRRSTAVGGGGTTVVEGGFLKGPLGMTLAPNGDLVTANGGDGNLVETTPTGAQFSPVATGTKAGGLFGLTIAPRGKGVYFVNDEENSLGLLH
jgi:sugar lactone lactonase YvrE